MWETVDGDRKTSIDKIENTAGATILWLIAKQIERMIINILYSSGPAEEYNATAHQNVKSLSEEALKAGLEQRKRHGE